MVKVKDLDKSLALKLADPITDNGDGEIFHREDRIKYLERAYSRLIRMLKHMMREYAPLFVNTKEYVIQTISNAEQKKGNGIEIYDTANQAIVLDKINELYVTTKSISTNEIQTADRSVKTNTYKASYIVPENYLSIKNDKNNLYNQKTTYFFTFLNNKLYLLPILNNTLIYSQIDVVLSKDIVNIDIDSELPIPNEYVDILIVLAASEGMQDIARQDKVQLYNNDVTGQLAILKGYADFKQVERGSDLNG